MPISMGLGMAVVRVGSIKRLHCRRVRLPFYPFNTLLQRLSQAGC